MTNASPDEVFRSLSDPTRRALLERLIREGELTVSALTAEAGVSQPAVSKHLGVLKRSGLVIDRSEGRSVRYAARPAGLAPMVDWLDFQGALWQDRFDRLEALLDRMDP